MARRYTARVLRRAAAPLVLLLATTCLAQSRSFIVGVLRADGLVVPFAAFDGKSWREAWEEPRLNVDIPVSIDSVPKRWWGSVAPASEWQAWLTDGSAPRTVHVEQPDLVPANCMRQVGLRMDYRSAEARPALTDHPYPKDGLVVSPAQPVGRIETLPKTAPEWHAFVPVVATAFNRQERRLFSGTPFGSAVPASKRESRPPTLESIYVYDSQPRIYAVEVSRIYYDIVNGRQQCQLLTFGLLWLRRTADGRATVLAASVIRDGCRRNRTLVMLPLGVVSIGPRVFWIAQLAGWNEEHYVVVEIETNTVKWLVDRFGGAC